VVVATPGALGLRVEPGTDLGELSCWPGTGVATGVDLRAEDGKMNDRDLEDGGRLFSAYHTPAGDYGS
jgi:hypothetical protein